MTCVVQGVLWSLPAQRPARMARWGARWLLACLAVCAKTVAAEPGVAPPGAGLVWQPSQTVALDGADLYLRAFHAEGMALGQAAQQLQRAWPQLDRLLFNPGWVLLSGLEAGSQDGAGRRLCGTASVGRHWLATLHPHPGGVRGRLSVLCVAPDRGRPSSVHHAVPGDTP